MHKTTQRVTRRPRAWRRDAADDTSWRRGTSDPTARTACEAGRGPGHISGARSGAKIDAANTHAPCLSHAPMSDVVSGDDLVTSGTECALQQQLWSRPISRSVLRSAPAEPFQFQWQMDEKLSLHPWPSRAEGHHYSVRA